MKGNYFEWGKTVRKIILHLGKYFIDRVNSRWQYTVVLTLRDFDLTWVIRTTVSSLTLVYFSRLLWRVWPYVIFWDCCEDFDLTWTLLSRNIIKLIKLGASNSKYKKSTFYMWLYKGWEIHTTSSIIAVSRIRVWTRTDVSSVGRI